MVRYVEFCVDVEMLFDRGSSLFEHRPRAKDPGTKAISIFHFSMGLVVIFLSELNDNRTVLEAATGYM